MNLDELVKKKKLTQTEFAALVDINQSTVSKALSEGILTRGGDWLQWNRELLRHSMETAAGRAGGPLDLAQERARLAKLQADRILMEMKKERRELMHVAPIVELVGGAYSNMRTHVLGLPTKIKSLVSYLLPRDVSAIDDLCREILTDIATAGLPPEVSTKIDELEKAAWGQIGDLNETANGRNRKSSQSKVARDKKARPEKYPSNVERADAISQAGS